MVDDKPGKEREEVERKEWEKEKEEVETISTGNRCIGVD